MSMWMTDEEWWPACRRSMSLPAYPKALFGRKLVVSRAQDRNLFIRGRWERIREKPGQRGPFLFLWRKREVAARRLKLNPSRHPWLVTAPWWRHHQCPYR